MADLRETIINVAAGLSEHGLMWTAGELADALIKEGVAFATVPDFAIAPDDLRPWGFAPGGYTVKCGECLPGLPLDGAALGAKYAWRCKDHAIEAWRKDMERAEQRIPGARFALGDKVRKVRGSSWRGTVCGFYSTTHTPIGYCVDSAFEPGSVQVWPEAALEAWNGTDGQ